MYWKVPRIMPRAVRLGGESVVAPVPPIGAVSGFARPKSSSFAPVFVIMMLPGFTSRPSRASWARYTSPIPPAPIGATTAYGPSCVPAFSTSSLRARALRGIRGDVLRGPGLDTGLLQEPEIAEPVDEPLVPGAERL